MYIPSFNKQTDLVSLHQLIKAYPLGLWSAITPAGVSVNPLPFVLKPLDGEFGTLHGHVAKNNPIWQECSEGSHTVVTFTGPQAYISPSWYNSKKEHGRVVPTWNYAIVSAIGSPIFHQDAEWLISHIDELTDQQEKSVPAPWRVSDAPSEFIDNLATAIVGVEIPITNLHGKWKLSQNRSEQDVLAVIEGLRKQGDMQSSAMATMMEQTIRSDRNSS